MCRYFKVIIWDLKLLLIINVIYLFFYYFYLPFPSHWKMLQCELSYFRNWRWIPLLLFHQRFVWSTLFCKSVTDYTGTHHLPHTIVSWASITIYMLTRADEFLLRSLHFYFSCSYFSYTDTVQQFDMASTDHYKNM